MRVFSILAGAAALAACATTEQRDQAATTDLTARLNRHVNSSMSAFIDKTGLTPDDYYSVDSGRVFVVKRNVGALTSPAAYGVPAVTSTFSCQLLVTTRLAANRPPTGSADAWIITKLATRGACANLPL